MSKNKFLVKLVIFLFALNKKIWSLFFENQSSKKLETYLPSYFLVTGRFTDVLNIYVLEKKKIIT